MKIKHYIKNLKNELKNNLISLNNKHTDDWVNSVKLMSDDKEMWKSMDLSQLQLRKEQTKLKNNIKYNILKYF